jgi:hypothetical protein
MREMFMEPPWGQSLAKSGEGTRISKKFDFPTTFEQVIIHCPPQQSVGMARHNMV